MFGFSITKLLFTAAAIIAVWYGFKYVGRMQERQKELAEERARAAKQAKRSGTGGAAKGGSGVEDMVECPACGAFVAAGSRACGKENCPYPG